MTTRQSSLKACISPLNCVFIQKEFRDSDMIFVELKRIAEKIPRTTVIESSNYYWKGVCKSFIFRFPDDLEMLKLKDSRGVIQIKSSSRFGASDLGVNQRRINYLLRQLEKLALKA
tara:strand:+ start:121 stop:468 length:348 start_codon:yes stop_codon:yes gene_type:complete